MEQRSDWVIPTAAVAAIVYFICWRLGESAFGRVLKGLREDPLATQALGKNVFGYKVAVFGITSALAGLAGAHVLRLARPRHPRRVRLRALAHDLRHGDLRRHGQPDRLGPRRGRRHPARPGPATGHQDGGQPGVGDPAHRLRPGARGVDAAAAPGGVARGPHDLVLHPAPQATDAGGDDHRGLGAGHQGRDRGRPRSRRAGAGPSRIALARRRWCSRRTAYRRASAASSPPTTFTWSCARARSPPLSVRTVRARQRCSTSSPASSRPTPGRYASTARSSWA